jgi:tRNA U34 5-carboxymethylaminomethyl modifying enzyme MnmG/GidA
MTITHTTNSTGLRAGSGFPLERLPKATKRRMRVSRTDCRQSTATGRSKTARRLNWPTPAVNRDCHLRLSCSGWLTSTKPTRHGIIDSALQSSTILASMERRSGTICDRRRGPPVAPCSLLCEILLVACCHVASRARPSFENYSF